MRLLQRCSGGEWSVRCSMEGDTEPLELDRLSDPCKVSFTLAGECEAARVTEVTLREGSTKEKLWRGHLRDSGSFGLGVFVPREVPLVDKGVAGVRGRCRDPESTKEEEDWRQVVDEHLR